MTIQPLPMDAVASACCGQDKLHRNTLKDAPASVWQELLLAPILSLNQWMWKRHGRL